MSYSEGKLSDYIIFNPKEIIKKGQAAPEVDMASIKPFYKYISAAPYSTYNGGMKFRNGDTLLARITPCLENGKTIFVDNLKNGEIGFGSTEYIVMRAKESKTIPEFVYYIATSNTFREKAISLMTGTSGRQRVQTEALMAENWHFPSVIDQEKIVAILAPLDLKIRQNTRTNDNLLEIAIAIFNNNFGGRIRGAHKISDFMTPKRGKALLSKDARPGVVPVVAGGLEAATYHDTANTKSPVVTISASGANAGFVNMWNLPVWSSDSSFIDETISPYVYFWYVMLKSRQKEIYDSQTGSAQAHIYPKHIAEMSIGDILEKEMVDYSAEVSGIFTKIGENNKENERLAALRDTLLPELINGKIDLSKVEI